MESIEKEIKITLTQKEFEEVKGLLISKYERLLTKKNRLYVCHLTTDVVDLDGRFKLVKENCNFYDNLLKKFLFKGE